MGVGELKPEGSETAPDFSSAADLSWSELAALWNRAYEGYVVPLSFSPEVMEAHVRRSGIDLGRSVVGLIGGEPFGLSLAAFEGGEAWIGGFGVAADRRRQGLASRLAAAQAEALDAAGVRETRLEVIDVNPAQEVYGRVGFVRTRVLTSFEIDLPGVERGPFVALDPEALGEAHARLNPEPPTWRRRVPVLGRTVEDGIAAALGIERDGRIGAYAVVGAPAERVALFDAAAQDEAAADALLQALASIRPGATLRLIDEAGETPLRIALGRRGARRLIGQYEMTRASQA